MSETTNTTITPEEEVAVREKQQFMRDELARGMSEIFGPILPQLCQTFGASLVLNGLFDLACGLASTSFSEEATPGVLEKLAWRVMQTDWPRHRARMFEGKLAIAKETKTKGGIILPK